MALVEDGRDLLVVCLGEDDMDRGLGRCLFRDSKPAATAVWLSAIGEFVGSWTMIEGRVFIRAERGRGKDFMARYRSCVVGC